MLLTEAGVMRHTPGVVMRKRRVSTAWHRAARCQYHHPHSTLPALMPPSHSAQCCHLTLPNIIISKQV